MRLQRVRRRAHEIRRAVLSGRDPVHHLACRSVVPVSLGGRLRRCRPVRLLGGDDFLGCPDDRYYVWVAKGSARIGLAQTTTAPAASAILDPRTGKPVAQDDVLCTALNAELADKGFLVTAPDYLITWPRTGSLMWMTFGLACCAVELMQMS